MLSKCDLKESVERKVKDNMADKGSALIIFKIKYFIGIEHLYQTQKLI